MKSPVQLSYPAQAAISVPKKNFRKAVDRNLLRRRIREAYRKNKQDLYKELASLELQVVFIMIFRGNIIADYTTIEQSIREMIILLKGRITKKLKKY